MNLQQSVAHIPCFWLSIVMHRWKSWQTDFEGRIVAALNMLQFLEERAANIGIL